jgi:DNA-binding NarL/FixJ family response regulator
VEHVLRTCDQVARFAALYGLSPRETQLLEAALAGSNNDEAAAKLHRCPLEKIERL